MTTVQGIAPVQATVTTAQVSQNMSDQQKVDFYNSALQNGVQVVQDKVAKNYYLRTEAQFSAAQGPMMVKVDRALAEVVATSLKSGGVLSVNEIANKIMPKITDQSRYSDAESIVARLLLAACDDRKVVKFHGDRINITNPGETALKSSLYSFWGKLGANARWSVANDPADVVLKSTQQTTQQTVQQSW